LRLRCDFNKCKTSSTCRKLLIPRMEARQRIKRVFEGWIEILIQLSEVRYESIVCVYVGAPWRRQDRRPKNSP
jgi:hypothetical protein